MEATCKTCPFWWHRAENGRLMDTACRREPQRTIYASARDEMVWMWPAAQPDEWCGEHPLRQRDRLAAMAMQGLMADPNLALTTDETRSAAAELAYRVADAMLTAASPPTGREG